jgi:cystathionine beta-lyase family protein involved in aluminum resistance
MSWLSQRAVAFCTVVQQCSPVNAHYRPEPGATPGYGDEVLLPLLTTITPAMPTVTVNSTMQKLVRLLVLMRHVHSSAVRSKVSSFSKHSIRLHYHRSASQQRCCHIVAAVRRSITAYTLIRANVMLDAHTLTHMQVIFADGTFMEGSTLELSADGPLREPYAVYAQGCTHWTHWAIILEEALVRMGLARAS